MSGSRIDFASADAASFNALRDAWRDVAVGTKLPAVAHRVASLLPGLVNREFGYAFPSDQSLADTLNCSMRLIGRGMVALESADLIERSTFIKRDTKSEAIGKTRRIFLTVPGERNTAIRSERNTPEKVNGTGERNTTEVRGTIQVSERNTVFRIYPDTITHDKQTSGSERRELGAVPGGERKEGEQKQFIEVTGMEYLPTVRSVSQAATWLAAQGVHHRDITDFAHRMVDCCLTPRDVQRSVDHARSEAKAEPRW